MSYSNGWREMQRVELALHTTDPRSWVLYRQASAEPIEAIPELQSEELSIAGCSPRIT